MVCWGTAAVVVNDQDAGSFCVEFVDRELVGVGFPGLAYGAIVLAFGFTEHLEVPQDEGWELLKLMDCESGLLVGRDVFDKEGSV